MVALFVLATFVLIITIDVIVTKMKKKRIEVFEPVSASIADRAVFSKNSIAVPKGFYFTKGHTWLKTEMNGDVKIGIDDFINKISGAFRVTLLKNAGEKVKVGEQIVKLETGKNKIILPSPVEGKIVSVNSEAVTNPQMIKDLPYELGWLFEIEPQNLKEAITPLKIGKDVVAWMSDEVTRFKDFLAEITSKHEPVGVTMYDGGNITEGVVSVLDENEVKTFEKEFLSI